MNWPEIIGIVAGALTSIIGSVALFLNRSKISNYFQKGKTDRIELTKIKSQKEIAKQTLKAGKDLSTKAKDPSYRFKYFDRTLKTIEDLSNKIEKDGKDN